jgi:hypothetical protein
LIIWSWLVVLVVDTKAVAAALVVLEQELDYPLLLALPTP